MALAKRRVSLPAVSTATPVAAATPVSPAPTAPPRVPASASALPGLASRAAAINPVRHQSTAPVQLAPHAARRSSQATDAALRAIPGQIARNLIVARHALNTTQESLAFESGVCRATIAQIESGESDCRLSTLAQLAQALGINPVLLLLRAADLAMLRRFIRPAEVDGVAGVLSPRDLDTMRRLRGTGLQRDLLKAARLGIDAARRAGLRSPGAAVGAGIGSLFEPGLGTALGAIYGVVLDDGQQPDGSLFEAGDGI